MYSVCLRKPGVTSQSYRRLAERRGGRAAGQATRCDCTRELDRRAPPPCLEWEQRPQPPTGNGTVFVVNSATPPHLGSLPLSTRDLRGPSIHIHITLMWGLGWTLPALDHRAGEAAAAPLYRARGEASGHNHTHSDLR